MEELYKTIDLIVSAQKKARQENDYLNLMLNAEALLERIPALLRYAIEQESEYRKFEAKLSDQKDGEKKNTSAYCETQAKATDFYKNWQEAKQFMEWMYEMVNMSKKLASGVDRELQAN